MRRQLALFSGLWFTIFWAVFLAVTFWWWASSLYFKVFGSKLPLPTRILVGHIPQPWQVWLIVAGVACFNVVLLGAASRMTGQGAEVFHRWAIRVQAIILILLVCFVVLAISLPFMRPLPVVR